MTIIGIRREDKNRWERRVPLVPADLKRLIEEHDLRAVVQPSPIRVFPDAEYEAIGATVQEDLSACDVVFAVKEIPPSLYRPETAYIFFSHTIKGQPYNMPKLAQILERGATLIDYECIVDEDGERLIFFGRHAGIAGMIDTLWALGRRLRWEGVENPFEGVDRALAYDSVDAAVEEVERVGEAIATGDALNASLAPLVCGFAGYGNVSQGAQRIFDHLPHETVTPEELPALFAPAAEPILDRLVKVLFKEKDIVAPIDRTMDFELQDYYDHPEKYGSQFDQYLEYLTLLVNCNYWDERYPRLVTKRYLREAAADTVPTYRLRVIADIGCDIEGAIEATVKTTNPGDPVFVYDPAEDAAADGVEGCGVVVLAVDTLPSEIPRESSTDFSHTLRRLVPGIVRADYTQPFDALELPHEVKRAVVAHGGELAPDYAYLYEHLEEHGTGGERAE